MMVVTTLVLVHLVAVVLLVVVALSPPDVTVAVVTTLLARMTAETVTETMIAVTVVIDPVARMTEIATSRKSVTVTSPARMVPMAMIGKFPWIPLRLEIMMNLIQLNRERIAAIGSG
jgi:hypothetical protein